GRAHHTEADGIEPLDRIDRKAIPAGQMRRPAVPRPAAQRMRTGGVADVALLPTILGGARVAVMPAIRHPLPDVAVHVMETPAIGLEAADRCGASLLVPRAAAELAVGQPLARDVVAATGLRRQGKFGR